MKLWVVGKLTSNETLAWEFAGVFDTEERAVSECVESNYFVGPCILNEHIPEEKVTWLDSYYPFYQQEGENNG